MPREPSRDVDDLFDVFEPWTEPETEPWEPPTPPPPPSPSLRPAPGPVGSPPHLTPDGAVDPRTIDHTPPSMRQPRRRVGPRIPPPEAPSPAPPDPVSQPAQFLREVGIPEIERLGRRMETLNHKLMIQDLLDLGDPAVRVLFWPRPGLMTPSHMLSKATLEIAVHRDEGGFREVIARYWEGGSPEEPVELKSTPIEGFAVGWIRGRMLDFIEAILSHA
jgi:hypothetical protein